MKASSNSSSISSGRKPTSAVLLLVLVVHSVGYCSASGPAFVKVRGGSTLMYPEHAAENEWRPDEQQHQQQQYYSNNEYYYQKYDPSVPKAEETVLEPESSASRASSAASSAAKTPVMLLSDMAAALQWTARLNRRLQRGIAAGAPPFAHAAGSGGGLDQLRGGGAASLATTSSTFRIPDVSPYRATEGSSLFHASAAPTDDFGTYLQRIFGALAEDSDDPQLELCLAMIYLDRATSVATSRTGTPVNKLPFLDPRTVHRLALSSMMLAASAVRHDIGAMEDLYDRVQEEFDVPNLRHMVEWMREALGESGVFVTPDELQEWKLLWESRFGTPAPHY